MVWPNRVVNEGWLVVPDMFAHHNGGCVGVRNEDGTCGYIAISVFDGG